MSGETRVGVRLSAKDMRQNGVPKAGFTQYYGIGKPFDEVMEQYERRVVLKPEVYAISAVLSNLLVAKTIATLSLLPPTAIKEMLFMGIKANIDVYQNLGILTYDALMQTYADEKMCALDLPASDPLSSVWQRYDVLERLLKERDKFTGNETTELPHTTIGRGIRTATTTMANLLEIIPLCSNKKDPKALSAIAANSFPFIANLATLHLIDFAEIDAWLRSDKENNDHNRYNPAHFKIKSKNGRESLLIDEDKLRQDSNLENFNRNIRESHLYCPGIQDLGEGSANRKLWEWHVKIAPIVYGISLNKTNPDQS